LSADLPTFSFPLRSLNASGRSALAANDSPFLLTRFHGDQTNQLVRRWCDSDFMSQVESPWPLVLYGPAGTGKSALAETLACRLSQQSQSCLLLAASDFRRQFLAAVATRTVAAFRDRIFSAEMLVLDNLVVPEDEPALVREMVQVIDFFRENRRPLIVTMQPAPWLICTSCHSLRSRLSEGLSIPVKHPGFAAKREIAAELLEHFDLKMIDEDLDWLANSLPESAPLIRNFLAQVAIETDDSLLTRQTLKSRTLKQPEGDPNAVHRLAKLVARRFGQRLSEINGKSRRKEVVRARSVTMYLARTLLGLKFRDIGDLVGRRDPSTVRHAHSQIQQAIRDDAHLSLAIDHLVREFQSCQARQPVQQAGQLVK